MRKFFLILRPIALIGIGLLFAVISAFLGHPALGSSSLAAGALIAASPTPATSAEVGSTDWITLVSIIIVLIVIIPIIIRRRSWNN